MGLGLCGLGHAPPPPSAPKVLLFWLFSGT